MVALTSLIVLIVGFMIYFAFEAFDETSILSSVFLGMFFLFALISFELSIEQRTFYLFALLFGLIVKLAVKFKSNSTLINDFNLNFSGIKFQIFSLFVGVGTLGFMFLASSSSGGLTIVGAPTLAISSVQAFKDRITLFFAPLSSGFLGIIENGLFIAVFEVLTLFKEKIFLLLGPVNKLGPLLVTGFGFGFFHLVAYGLNIQAVLWASMIMIIWLVIYDVINDRTPMDVAHFFWNGILTAGRGLTIAI
jgi:hypothetical protein